MRRLFHDAALYTLSNLLVRGLGLLLLPVYVRVLSREDFGRLDLATVAGSLVAVVVGLEVTQGVMRFVADGATEDKDRRQWVAAGFSVTLLCFTTFVVACVLFRDPLSTWVFDAPGSTWTPVWAAGWFAATGIVYFWTVVLRALLRSRMAALTAILSAVCVGAGGLLAVGIVGGVESLLLGNMLGQIVVATTLTFLMRRWAFVPVERERYQPLLGFSAPLVVSSVAIVGALYVDRVLVRALLGLDDLAVYGVAARLATGIGFILVGLQNALTPVVYSSLEDEQLGGRLGRLARWYTLGSLILVAVLAAVSPWAIDLLAGDGYEGAAVLLPVLALAVLVRGSYTFFPGLFVAKRTKVIAAVNLAALGGGAGLAVVLIPLGGLMGAAVAALVGSVVSVVPVYWLGQRHVTVR